MAVESDRTGPRLRPLRPLWLTWVFLRIGIMNELQYRVNFFIQLFQSVVALITALAVLGLVFSQTRELGGWSRDELLVVMGVHILVGGFIRAVVQPNIVQFIEDVREGKLDYALVKPRDAQLLVSIRQVRIWQSVDIAVGAAVLAGAMVRLESGVDPLHAVGFALALLLGAVMIYCFWLILSIGAFWIVRMEFIVELFEGVYQAGRWPVTLYPGWLRASLTFLIPLAFAVTVPAQALTGRLTAGALLLEAGFAAVLFAFTRWFWRLGLSCYSGASA